MGWPEVAEKWSKITNFPVVHGGRRRHFAGPIPARPAAVCREIPPAGSSGCGAPSRPAHVAAGWPVVPHLVQSFSALAIEQKAQLGSRFGELFPRVFGAQKVSWGLGFHLASQTMFI